LGDLMNEQEIGLHILHKCKKITEIKDINSKEILKTMNIWYNRSNFIWISKSC